MSANVFSPVDQRKKAPPVIAYPGLKTGLLFPSEAGTRPAGNDQLNDVWREVCRCWPGSIAR